MCYIQARMRWGECVPIVVVLASPPSLTFVLLEEPVDSTNILPPLAIYAYKLDK